MKKTRQEKGITLIALIITIVVLLILAVVAIRAVQGDGIIEYAKNARNGYEQAQANEQAQLQNYLDILDENNSKGDTTTPIVHNGVIPEGGVYTQRDGTIYNAGDNFPALGSRDEYVYGDYKYIYTPDNGYWSVTVRDKTKTSYDDIISSINGFDKLYLDATFYQCTNLEKAPKIPTTTVGMINAFGDCTALTDISNVEIPDGITSLTAIFCGCSALKDASTLKIPSTVTTMISTFERCTSLTKKPTIPSSVTTPESTIFYGCTQFGY